MGSRVPLPAPQPCLLPVSSTWLCGVSWERWGLAGRTARAAAQRGKAQGAAAVDGGTAPPAARPRSSLPGSQRALLVLPILHRCHGLHRLAGSGTPRAGLPNGREMGAGGPQVRSAAAGRIDAARRSCCRQPRPAAAAADILPAAAMPFPSAAWSGCKRCAPGWRSSTATLWSGCRCWLGTCKMRWAGGRGEGFRLRMWVLMEQGMDARLNQPPCCISALCTLIFSLLALLAPAPQASLDAIASQTRVLLSTAGPFAL